MEIGWHCITMYYYDCFQQKINILPIRKMQIPCHFKSASLRLALSQFFTNWRFSAFRYLMHNGRLSLLVIFDSESATGKLQLGNSRVAPRVSKPPAVATKWWLTNWFYYFCRIPNSGDQTIISYLFRDRPFKSQIERYFKSSLKER